MKKTIQIDKNVSILLMLILILLPNFFLFFPDFSPMNAKALLDNFIKNFFSSIGLFQILLISILLFISSNWLLSLSIINAWLISLIFYIFRPFDHPFTLNFFPSASLGLQGAAEEAYYINGLIAIFLLGISTIAVVIFNTIAMSVYLNKKPSGHKKLVSFLIISPSIVFAIFLFLPLIKWLASH